MSLYVREYVCGHRSRHPLSFSYLATPPKNNTHTLPLPCNPPTSPPPPTPFFSNKHSCGNVAAVLAFDEHLNREFKMFKEVPESEFGQNPERRNLVPYFL